MKYQFNIHKLRFTDNFLSASLCFTWRTINEPRLLPKLYGQKTAKRLGNKIQRPGSVACFFYIFPGGVEHTLILKTYA